MATQYPKLVNKQFNSPIGLYSENNVREILDRQTQLLANGAVGINFHDPMATKPTNLHNSAVLRMLEEEENRQRNGHAPGFKTVNGSKPLREWPPPGVNRTRPKNFVVSGGKRVAWPPPRDSEEEISEHAPAQAQGGPQYSQTQPQPQTHGLNQNQNQVAGIHKLIPINQSNSPVPIQVKSFAPNQQQNFAPSQPNQTFNQPNFDQAPSKSPQSFSQPQFNQPAVRPQSFAPNSGGINPSYFGVNPSYQESTFNPNLVTKPWAPVHSPTQPSSPRPGTPQLALGGQNSPQYQPNKPSFGVQPGLQSVQTPPQLKPQPQTFQSVTSSGNLQQQVQAPPPATRTFEPPPSTITLRPEAPVTQKPAPVFESQPATATFKGGKHLRGDLKWPPEDVKTRMEEENRARMELTKGPAFRPRKVEKDYSGFFAQHALNSTYPGYKIPPGTQFYEHRPVL